MHYPSIVGALDGPKRQSGYQWIGISNDNASTEHIAQAIVIDQVNGKIKVN
jgi:hypothetical protein